MSQCENSVATSNLITANMARGKGTHQMQDNAGCSLTCTCNIHLFILHKVVHTIPMQDVTDRHPRSPVNNYNYKHNYNYIFIGDVKAATDLS
jgi:hypothetical protein